MSNNTEALPPMEQLIGFVDWERKHNPGKKHVAEWALAEIERLNTAELAALQALRCALQHAEWEDKHIHPVGAESFQCWRISIRLPVPLTEADKSPKAALNRFLKGKT